jgi:hypothetical protein
VVEADLGKYRIAQISAREVRPSQLGECQVSARHLGTAEVAVRVLASSAPARLVPVSRSAGASSDLGCLGRSWQLTS